MERQDAVVMEKCTFLRHKLAFAIDQIHQLCDKAWLEASVYLRQRQTEIPVPLDLQQTLYVCVNIMTAVADKTGFKLKSLGNARDFEQYEIFVFNLVEEAKEMVKHLTSVVDQDILSLRYILANGNLTLEKSLRDCENRIHLFDDVIRILTSDVEDLEGNLQRDFCLDEENPSDSSEELPQLSDFQEGDYEPTESGGSFEISNLNEKNPSPPIIIQRDTDYEPSEEILQPPDIQEPGSEKAVTMLTVKWKTVFHPHHTWITGCILIGLAVIVPIMLAVAFPYMQNIGTILLETKVPLSHCNPEKTQDKLQAESKSENPEKPRTIVAKTFSVHFHPGCGAVFSIETQPIVPYSGQWEIEKSAGWTEVEDSLYPPRPGLYRIRLTFKQLGLGNIEILIFLVDSHGILLKQHVVLSGQTTKDKDLAIEEKKIRFEVDVGISVWGSRRRHAGVESFRIDGKWVGD